MKYIDVRAATETEALKKISEQLRMSENAFEIIDSKPVDADNPDEEKKILVKLRVREDFLIDLTRKKVIGLLKHMEIEAEVSVRRKEDFLSVDILSPKGSLLIGRRGQTLDSIQHIINRMISRNDKSMPLILVDVEKYRTRLNQRLQGTARRAAEKVMKSGKPIKLEPMPSSERKFIHKCLSSIKGIKTYSMGRDRQRRVIVDLEAPRKMEAVRKKEAPRKKETKKVKEKVLPEILKGVFVVKKARSLFNDDVKRPKISAKPVTHSDDLGELLDPGILDY
jgi:spoIIIJ-associated protein